MKQKEVFNKIGGIIQELRDQYDYLKTVTDDLNDLELELFVANAHFLTDHIEVLCKLNLQNRVKRPLEKPQPPQPPPVEKYFEPVVQQMKHGSEEEEKIVAAEPAKAVDFEIFTPEHPDDQPVPQINLDAGAPADTYSFMREEPEIIKHELILDEAMLLDEDEPAEAEHEPVVEESVIEAAPPVAEQTKEEIPAFKPEKAKPAKEPETKPAEDEVLTINQKISSQLGDKGIARTEQLSVKPISDIKLAITLNDKLLYVKDLFNGYNLAYSEAIEILNRFNTFEEASRFLKTNYITKNNWESKPATTEKFYALLRRRYA